MAKKQGSEARQGQAGNTGLGQYLAQVRRLRKLTLREVEEATEKQVSNAYLSQLEKGKISKPSPNVLHVLSKVYSIAYDTLMEKAGYVASMPAGAGVLRSGTHDAKRTPRNALTNEELTADEEAKLLEYLAFLRRR